MAKLILASVLCIFLLVKGIEAEEVEAGESCATDTTNTCKATDYCENNFCKTKLDAGGDCSDTATTVCNPDATATLTCDGTCKVIAGQACTKDTTVCIAHAECTAESECTCTGEFTASSDSTQCVANAKVGEACDGKTCVTTATCDTVASNKFCRLKIGETCTTGSVQCVTGSECSTEETTKGKCTCSAGATPSEDKTKCGAMGIAASMLLVVATFVTSRFV